MRSKNLKNLRNKRENNIYHYLNVLSKLNDELEGRYQLNDEQLCLFEDEIFDREINDKLEKILNNMIKSFDGDIVRYALITFEQNCGNVTNIAGIIPVKGINDVYQEDWSECISAEYVDESVETNIAVSDTVILLQHKTNLKKKKEKETKNNV